MKREAFFIGFITRFPGGGRAAAPTQYEAQNAEPGHLNFARQGTPQYFTKLFPLTKP
jgi:hypothetical protein